MTLTQILFFRPFPSYFNSTVEPCSMILMRGFTRRIQWKIWHIIITLNHAAHRSFLCWVFFSPRRKKFGYSLENFTEMRKNSIVILSDFDESWNKGSFDFVNLRKIKPFHKQMIHLHIIIPIGYFLFSREVSRSCL